MTEQEFATKLNLLIGEAINHQKLEMRSIMTILECAKLDVYMTIRQMQIMKLKKEASPIIAPNFRPPSDLRS